MQTLSALVLIATAGYLIACAWHQIADRGRADDLFAARRILRLPNWPARMRDQVSLWRAETAERRRCRESGRSAS